MIRRALPSRRAFTLVEAITAVVILAVAVPPLLVAMQTFSLRRADATLASRARWIASERLEDVIADRHSATRGYAWVITSNYPAENAVTGFTNFSRSTSISEVASDLSTAQANSGIKLITVTVQYADTRGTTRSFALSTVLTNY